MPALLHEAGQKLTASLHVRSQVAQICTNTMAVACGKDRGADGADDTGSSGSGGSSGGDGNAAEQQRVVL